MSGTSPRLSVEPGTEPAESAEPRARINQPLIYIVDDEPMVGEVVQTVLEAAGFRTRLFQDPAVALQSLAQASAQPQALLTDFKMQSMNGMELIQGCKMIHPALKTVLFSSTLEPEDIQVYPVQPDAFVSKPFHPQGLGKKIRDLLTPGN